MAIAFVATLIAVTLIAKPGTGSPTPDLSDGGRAGLALAICAIVVGLANAIHLALTKDQYRSRPSSERSVPLWRC